MSFLQGTALFGKELAKLPCDRAELRHHHPEPAWARGWVQPVRFARIPTLFQECSAQFGCRCPPGWVYLEKAFPGVGFEASIPWDKSGCGNALPALQIPLLAGLEKI